MVKLTGSYILCENRKVGPAERNQNEMVFHNFNLLLCLQNRDTAQEIHPPA